MNIKQKIARLREMMRLHHLDYYLVPGTDPHQNEYLPAMWDRRTFISGFDGSNGDIAIGLDRSYLWTDGRYELQAKQQLDSHEFEIFISAQGSDSSLVSFFSKLSTPIRLGVDPQLISVMEAKRLEEALREQGSSVIYLQENLIDALHTTLPSFKPHPIQILSETETGEATAHKIKKLQAHLNGLHCDGMILNDLPSIAWLFNLRGQDIPFNPLFLSYALIRPTLCTLYLNPESVTAELKAELARLQIELKDYRHFYQDYATLHFKRLNLDPRKNSQALLNGTHFEAAHFEASPIDAWKACKNPVEIQGAIEAHRLDALAEVQFLTWLETHGVGETECSISEVLLRFRQQATSFQSPSFATIAGYADHGAIIHYHPHKNHEHTIGNEALLLIDSGGQYREGTTDITRTVHLGTPSAFEKECYTLVLKGHLALRMARFSHGTRGEHLDALARQFLWQKGFNYGHGTGHGVGAYLCVHEGPQRISTGATTTPLLPGMIVSNEPGLYLPGRFGIRIENLIYVKKAKIDSEFGAFYEFEDLTLVPYSRKLIAVDLLSPEERQSINQYHKKVWDRLHQDLTGDALAWLKRETAAL